jgi:hypothetical protein
MDTSNAQLSIQINVDSIQLLPKYSSFIKNLISLLSLLKDLVIFVELCRMDRYYMEQFENGIIIKSEVSKLLINGCYTNIFVPLHL